MTKKIFASLLLLCLWSSAIAQKHEFGLFVGSTGYFGDVGYERAEQVLFHQSPALGFVYKANIHNYLSLRSSIQAGTIEGRDEWAKNLNTQMRNLSFKSNIIDFNLGFEFNFMKFAIRKRRTIHSPYVFAGISALSFNPQAENSHGVLIDLQPLGTEGQGTSASAIGKYDLMTWAIPFGLGYKVNFGTRWAISCEWTWRSARTDYLDDVSGYYVDDAYLSETAAEMANPTDIDIVPGMRRGNPNNNDWYNFAGFTISYKIKNRPVKCPKALLP